MEVGREGGGGETVSEEGWMDGGETVSEEGGRDGCDCYILYGL